MSRPTGEQSTVDVEIRPSRLEDAGAISRLTSQLGYSTTEAGVRARLQRFEGEDHRVMVAVENGRVLGFIHVALRASVESDTWSEVLGFVVDEAERGRGVGRRLLREACEWAAGSGGSRMRVRSKTSREDAHRFYEARGFRFVKTQRVMDLDLDSHRE